MPIQSTFGALKTFKIGAIEQNIYYFIDLLPANKNADVQTTVLECFGNNIWMGGYVISASNTSLRYNSYLQIDENLNALPNIVYQSFTEGTSGGSPQRGIQVIDIKYDSNNNNNYVLTHFAVSTSNQGSYLSIFDSNNVVQSEYYVPPVASNYLKRPRNVHLLGNGTYSILGTTQENATDLYAYITNFNANTVNFNKRLRPSTGGNTTIFTDEAGNTAIDSNENYIFSVDGSANSEGTICNVSANGNVINYQKRFTYGSNIVTINNVIVDSNDNVYLPTIFVNANAAVSHLIKIDNTGNISWQKESNLKANADGFYFFNGTIDSSNVYMITERYFTGANVNLPLYGPFVTNIDTGSGNINWQREITFSGTGEYANANRLNWNTRNIQIKDSNMYITGTVTFSSVAPEYVSSYIVKLPKDGTIIGTGNYLVSTSNLGNLYMQYVDSNVSLTNGNLTSSNGTLVLSNATAVSVVDPNVTQNTTVSFSNTIQRIPW